MKVTIITVVYDGEKYLDDCIKSVLDQSFKNIEYIVIDGGSRDGTVDVIKAYAHRLSAWVSEPDSGIYDAMNKGISLASGDVVGFLNSDDLYINTNVVSAVANEFETKDVDSVFADLVYVKRDDPRKIVRYYRSSGCGPGMFAFGRMPAHPTFFVKRSCYERHGSFKTDYKIAADFELLARYLVNHKVTYSYIPKVIIKMRVGGVSTRNLRSNIILNKEILRACAENGIQTNMCKIYLKYFTKIFQYMNKPNENDLQAT